MTIPVRGGACSWIAVTVLLVTARSGAVFGAERPSQASGSNSIPIEVVTAAAIMETHAGPDGIQVARWVPATDIREGQVVYYTLTVRNPGAQPAHDVVVTKPVPANTVYIPGSAVAPNATVTFSVDGGVTFAPAKDLVLQDERGRSRPVPPENYTHIRWRMRYPLAPAAAAYARFRAVFQ